MAEKMQADQFLTESKGDHEKLRTMDASLEEAVIYNKKNYTLGVLDRLRQVLKIDPENKISNLLLA